MPKRTRFSVGDRTGTLAVLDVLPCRKSKSGKGGGNGGAVLIVRCECGVTKEMATQSFAKAKSCGGPAHARKKPKKYDHHMKLPEGEASINYVMSRYKIGARRRGLSFELSREQFIGLIFEDCAYCGQPPSKVRGKEENNGKITCNGIDRVDNLIGYVDGNVVPACTECNLSKHIRGKDNFLSHAARVMSRKEVILTKIAMNGVS